VLWLRQNSAANRSRSVNLTLRTAMRGDLWARMVQTHFAGGRTGGSQASQLLKLSEMGTVPGSLTQRGRA